MKPEIQILGISIKTFGVAFALGFLACGLLDARRLRELGKPVDWAYEMVFAALVGGIIGARLWWVAENWSAAWILPWIRIRARSAPCVTPG